MIPDGYNLTYTGTWKTARFSQASTTIDRVSADLARAGLPVRSFTTDAGFFANLPIGVERVAFNVTLHLQVANGLGFQSPDDVISIVRHWVQYETDVFPDADSLPYIADPATGIDVPTGQPAPKAAIDKAGCIAGTSTDLSGSFSLSCWFSNLTQKGLATTGFLALLIIGGLGLLIFARPAAAAAAARRGLGGT
jgi:hypothetical protein